MSNNSNRSLRSPSRRASKPGRGNVAAEFENPCPISWTDGGSHPCDARDLNHIHSTRVFLSPVHP